MPPQPGTLVGNLGEPIILPEIKIDGFAAEAAKDGKIKVWTKLALTSDDPIFHRMATNLIATIKNHTAGISVDFDRTKVMLLVIKPGKHSELWADTAAMSVAAMAKRALEAGNVVFENDIVDVIAMSFPLVEINKEDRVFCLFRQDWRFALYFDTNPDKNLSLDEFQRSLGNLFRNLKYRHIYDAIESPEISEKLLKAGWFPFAEIITSEFPDLIKHCEANLDLQSVEERIIASFDEERLTRLLQRWLAKPHFASREVVLRSAVKNFLAKDPVAVIKTIVTEIEGILNEAYRTQNGVGAKGKALREFAVALAERKAGNPYTLLMAKPFAEYLEKRMFADFDPLAGNGDAASRHAVGHGEAKAESYTQVAALQALLTLDQFAFST